ncbi:Frizzled-4 [Araneus ventricosus]|uniref:Frizzled-4 n=1 Tax=Araneus ventricosus TaxID=182803 RepID=A0A4Y2BGX0_ARAVE|nr:Frizzled-4 [Araneus ventricosus]
MLCLVWLAVLLDFGTVFCDPDLEITRTCEPIRIKTCSNIGYNVTGMPNFVGHDIQRDADLQLQTFTPLIQYGCSSRLRFFLCSVYAPMCTEKVPQPIGPCRPLCESVQGLCEPVLLEFGFKWPPALNCSQFPPVNNEKHMCMEGPQHEEQKHVPFRDRRPSRPGIHRGSGNSVSRPRYHHPVSSVRTISRSMCKHLRFSDRYYYINNTERCAAACRADILYSKENKEFAQVWIAVWSCLCFLSTLFTIIKSFSKGENFRYPEKIIIILSWCYFVYSIAFFIRLVGGREDMACHWDSPYGEPLLVQGGLDNINCTVVFTLLYFFGMSSFIWWVILTLNWFLTAGLGWNSEYLERFGTYFHVAAWLLPAIKTIAILVMQAVDADELTGICFVGNQDLQAMVRFVIIPSVTYFAVGMVFLLAGVIAIFKNKKYRSKIGNRDDKWEVLMFRIGIFAILYTIPSICVLGANIYEFTTREAWLSANSTVRPNVEIFTLKIFMSLVVGITTGVWLYTSKTPQFKRVNLNLSSKLCPQHRSVPIYSPQNHVLLLNGLRQKMTIV